MALLRSIIDLMDLIGCDLGGLIEIIRFIWRCIVETLVSVQLQRLLGDGTGRGGGNGSNRAEMCLL